MCRLYILIPYLAGTIAASVPWQDSRRDLLQDARHVDLPPNVFAPGGRLPSIEQIIPICMTDDPSCSLVIAFWTKEGMALVATRPKSPYLFDVAQNSTTNSSGSNSSESVTSNHTSLLTLLQEPEIGDIPSNKLFDLPFAYLAPNLLAITAGNAADSQLLRLLLQDAAESARNSLSRPTARSSARTLADQLQQRTQQAGKGRLLASTAVLIDAHELWRVEPTGQFYQCQVAVAGRAADKLHRELLQKLVKDERANGKRLSRQRLHALVNDLSIDKCLGLASRTIQSVLSPDKSEGNLYLMGLSTTAGRDGEPSKLARYGHTDLMTILDVNEAKVGV